MTNTNSVYARGGHSSGHRSGGHTSAAHTTAARSAGNRAKTTTHTSGTNTGKARTTKKGVTSSQTKSFTKSTRIVNSADSTLKNHGYTNTNNYFNQYNNYYYTGYHPFYTTYYPWWFYSSHSNYSQTQQAVLSDQNINAKELSHSMQDLKDYIKVKTDSGTEVLIPITEKQKEKIKTGDKISVKNGKLYVNNNLIQ